MFFKRNRYNSSDYDTGISTPSAAFAAATHTIETPVFATPKRRPPRLSSSAAATALRYIPPEEGGIASSRFPGRRAASLTSASFYPNQHGSRIFGMRQPLQGTPEVWLDEQRTRHGSFSSGQERVNSAYAKVGVMPSPRRVYEENAESIVSAPVSYPAGMGSGASSYLSPGARTALSPTDDNIISRTTVANKDRQGRTMSLTTTTVRQVGAFELVSTKEIPVVNAPRRFNSVGALRQPHPNGYSESLRSYDSELEPANENPRYHPGESTLEDDQTSLQDVRRLRDHSQKSLSQPMRRNESTNLLNGVSKQSDSMHNSQMYFHEDTGQKGDADRSGLQGQAKQASNDVDDKNHFRNGYDNLPQSSNTVGLGLLSEPDGKNSQSSQSQNDHLPRPALRTRNSEYENSARNRVSFGGAETTHFEYEPYEDEESDSSNALGKKIASVFGRKSKQPKQLQHVPPGASTSSSIRRSMYGLPDPQTPPPPVEEALSDSEEDDSEADSEKENIGPRHSDYDSSDEDEFDYYGRNNSTSHIESSPLQSSDSSKVRRLGAPQLEKSRMNGLLAERPPPRSDSSSSLSRRPPPPPPPVAPASMATSEPYEYSDPTIGSVENAYDERTWEEETHTSPVFDEPVIDIQPSWHHETLNMEPLETVREVDEDEEEEEEDDLAGSGVPTMVEVISQGIPALRSTYMTSNWSQARPCLSPPHPELQTLNSEASNLREKLTDSSTAAMKDNNNFEIYETGGAADDAQESDDSLFIDARSVVTAEMQTLYLDAPAYSDGDALYNEASNVFENDAFFRDDEPRRQGSLRRQHSKNLSRQASTRKAQAAQAEVEAQAAARAVEALEKGGLGEDADTSVERAREASIALASVHLPPAHHPKLREVPPEVISKNAIALATAHLPPSRDPEALKKAQDQAIYLAETQLPPVVEYGTLNEECNSAVERPSSEANVTKDVPVRKPRRTGLFEKLSGSAQNVPNVSSENSKLTTEPLQNPSLSPNDPPQQAAPAISAVPAPPIMPAPPVPLTTPASHNRVPTARRSRNVDTDRGPKLRPLSVSRLSTNNTARGPIVKDESSDEARDSVHSEESSQKVSATVPQNEASTGASTTVGVVSNCQTSPESKQERDSTQVRTIPQVPMQLPPSNPMHSGKNIAAPANAVIPEMSPPLEFKTTEVPPSPSAAFTNGNCQNGSAFKSSQTAGKFLHQSRTQNTSDQVPSSAPGRTESVGDMIQKDRQLSGRARSASAAAATIRPGFTDPSARAISLHITDEATLSPLRRGSLRDSKFGKRKSRLSLFGSRSSKDRMSEPNTLSGGSQHEAVPANKVLNQPQLPQKSALRKAASTSELREPIKIIRASEPGQASPVIRSPPAAQTRDSARAEETARSIARKAVPPDDTIVDRLPTQTEFEAEAKAQAELKAHAIALAQAHIADPNSRANSYHLRTIEDDAASDMSESSFTRKPSQIQVDRSNGRMRSMRSFSGVPERENLATNRRFSMTGSQPSHSSGGQKLSGGGFRTYSLRTSDTTRAAPAAWDSGTGEALSHAIGHHSNAGYNFTSLRGQETQFRSRFSNDSDEVPATTERTFSSNNLSTSDVRAKEHRRLTLKAIFSPDTPASEFLPHRHRHHEDAGVMDKRRTGVFKRIFAKY